MSHYPYFGYNQSSMRGAEQPKEMEQLRSSHQDYHNTLYGMSTASGSNVALTSNNPSSYPTAANAQKYSYAPTKKPVSKWIKIGIPVVLIIIAIGVGVGLGLGNSTNPGSVAVRRVGATGVALSL